MRVGGSSRPHGARENTENGSSEPGNAMARLGSSADCGTWDLGRSDGGRAHQAPMVAPVGSKLASL
jgi:hypothetical protein